MRSWWAREFGTTISVSRPNPSFTESKYGQVNGETTVYSLSIYSHELLFASEEAATEYRKDTESNGKHVVAGENSVKKLEFREFRRNDLIQVLRSSKTLFPHTHFSFLLCSFLLFSVGNGLAYEKALISSCDNDLAQGSPRRHQDAGQWN